MGNRIFLIFCLVLVFGIQVAYFALKSEFGGADVLRAELELIKRELEVEKARTQVAQFELESYKQIIAANLPDKIKHESYVVRGLASQTRKPQSSDLSHQKMDNELSDIKQNFLREEYAISAKNLEKFLEKYPDFPLIHEAYFLYASSLYELKQYEKTLTIVDIMVDLFPENELTGFGLLLTADIFSKQERPEEAKQVLEAIIRNFPFPEIKERAAKKIKELEI